MAAVMPLPAAAFPAAIFGVERDVVARRALKI
jgi:hypothetical protein